MTLDDTTGTQDEVVEAPDDIRSAIAAAMDAVEPAGDTADPPADTRVRGPDGKFAKAETTEAAPAETVEGVEGVANPPVEAEKPVTEPTATGVEPPSNWKDADKAAFKGLPPDAQTFLLSRHRDMEADYTRKTQEVAALKRDFEPVAGLLAPHYETMRAAGHTPATLVKAWMDVEQGLQEGRAIPIIASLVNGYKVDSAALAAALGLHGTPAPGTVAPPDPQNPAPAALPPEVLEKLNSFDQFIATQHETQRLAQVRQHQELTGRVVSVIDNFKSSRDANGAPLHPHFDAVEDHMARLALASKSRGEAIPSLDELYEQAVWANPSTRQIALAAQTAAQEAQRQAEANKAASEARARAEKARRASSSVTGSPGLGQTPTGGTAKAGGGSLRDDLMAAFEDAASP